MMLIGWGMGVAVGLGLTVGVGVKVRVGVCVAVDTLIGGADVFITVIVCVAQADRKRVKLTSTNKAFFITELLTD
jgi:hypothetical protein